MTSFGGRKDWLYTATNTAGLAIAAVAGLLVSVILARGAGAEAVGQFNQLAAIYIVASQFAAFGLHLAALHLIPITPPGQLRLASHAALLAVLPMASLTVCAVWSLAPYCEALLESPGLTAGVQMVALATGLFGINKLLLSFLNVFGHLVWLAIAQALRPVIWLVGAIVLSHGGNLSQWALGVVFVAGESGVLLFAFSKLAPFLLARSGPGLPTLMGRYLRFGLRAFPSNAMTELNTRVDVLVLGVFASDRVVGVYSFAALIAEGVFQIGVFLRTIVNNRTVAALMANNAPALDSLTKSVGRIAFRMSGLAAVAALVATPFIIDVFRLDPSLHEGSLVLAMLLIGVVASSNYSPFWNVLLLAGRPGLHSIKMLGVLLFNLALNVVAVPIAGMVGAAAATALTLLVFPLMLRYACFRVLGMKLRTSW